MSIFESECKPKHVHVGHYAYSTVTCKIGFVTLSLAPFAFVIPCTLSTVVYLLDCPTLQYGVEALASHCRTFSISSHVWFCQSKPEAGNAPGTGLPIGNSFHRLSEADTAPKGTVEYMGVCAQNFC